MINKQFYTSKWLIPIFVISVLIFTLLTVGVMHRTSFIQHIDVASLQLMTDYFGTPERGFEGSWFNTI
ncbi:MAG: PAP2 family protein, partial [Staphylococcus lugdunensis]|nr:PAP2 family protein [Staphylococcus lugdunensis]